MNPRSIHWTLVFALFGCTPTAPATEPCPLDAVRVEAEFERGRALLEASRDGEHFRSEPFEEALRVLQVVAASGSRDAQSLFGRTLFGVLYTRRAPVEEERDAYVDALAAIRIAGRAGDDVARDFLPGWSEDMPDRDVSPLDALPEGWLDEALARSQLGLECPQAEPQP